MKLKIFKKLITAFCAVTIVATSTVSNVGAVKITSNLSENESFSELSNELNGNIESLKKQLKFIEDVFLEFEPSETRKEEIVLYVNNAENKLNQINELTIADISVLRSINNLVKTYCQNLFCIDDMELILQIGDEYISSVKGKVCDEYYTESDMIADMLDNNGNLKQQLLNLTNPNIHDLEFLKNKIKFIFINSNIERLLNEATETKKEYDINLTTDKI